MAWTAPRTWTDGELVTASIMNTHIRDNMLVGFPHLLVRKASDESVTSSTAEQDDNELLFNVPANEVWQMIWFLRYEAGTTGDIKFRWSFPTGGELNFTSMFVNASGTVTDYRWAATTSPATSLPVQGGGAGATNRHVFQVWGVYVNGGTGGNVTLQWAQNTSDATASIVKANSTLWGCKLA